MKQEIESKTPKPWIVVFIVAAITFIGVLVFSSHAIFKRYDLGLMGSLGDAVNGLSAPIISFCSVILVYITFREQNKSNIIQRRALERQDLAIEKQLESNKLIQGQWQFETILKLFDRLTKLFGKLSVFRISDATTYLGKDAIVCHNQEFKNRPKENRIYFNSQLEEILYEFDILIEKIITSNIEHKDYLISKVLWFYDRNLGGQLVEYGMKINTDQKPNQNLYRLIDKIDKAINALRET